jgi:hypothetical protein
MPCMLSILNGIRLDFQIPSTKKAHTSMFKIVTMMYSNITLSKYPCSATFLVFSKLVLRSGKPSTDFVWNSTGDRIIETGKKWYIRDFWRGQSREFLVGQKYRNFRNGSSWNVPLWQWAGRRLRKWLHCLGTNPCRKYKLLWRKQILKKDCEISSRYWPLSLTFYY